MKLATDDIYFIRSRVRITTDAVIFELIATPSRLWPSGIALSFCTDPVLSHITHVRRTVNRYISTPVLLKGNGNLTTSLRTAKFSTIKMSQTWTTLIRWSCLVVVTWRTCLHFTHLNSCIHRFPDEIKFHQLCERIFFRAEFTAAKLCQYDVDWFDFHEP